MNFTHKMYRQMKRWYHRWLLRRQKEQIQLGLSSPPSPLLPIHVQQNENLITEARQINCLNEPLIIVGTHRSGTSLLTKILERCGLFFGNDLRKHHESYFFLSLNQWILQRGHADWDNPVNISYLMANQEISYLLASQLRKIISSKQIRYYLGNGNWKRWRQVEHLPFLWGWKDPRNTYTLPIWHILFPKAKVLRIYRNGIDVAKSLQSREQRRMQRSDVLNNPLFSVKCLRLEGAFSLWAEYEEQSLQIISTLPLDRVFSVQFEAFMTKPLPLLKKVLTFLNMHVAEDVLARAVADIRPDRAYDFSTIPEFHAFYKSKQNHPLMQHLGYGDIKLHRQQNGMD